MWLHPGWCGWYTVLALRARLVRVCWHDWGRDNGRRISGDTGDVIARHAAMEAGRCMQAAFCCRILREENWGRISEPGQCVDGGCTSNQPLVEGMVWGLADGHPLFWRDRREMQHVVDMRPEQCEETTTVWCGAGHRGILCQFICQCTEVLGRG